MQVLIVEDTQTIATLVKIYLMGWNLTFLDAKDGMQGLAMARASKPDLVISDVRMPRMDGFELCAALRADKDLHAVPVLLLTSLQDEVSRQKGRLVGATAFVKKPVALDELRAIVCELLHLAPKGGAADSAHKPPS